MLPRDHAERVARAALALDGLSVGDALGQICMDVNESAARLVADRTTPAGPWPWTDDTAMALSIYEVLSSQGHIDQDALAALFAQRFKAEPGRGYGSIAFQLLGKVALGAAWRPAAEGIVPGGSFGNGSAMRIAPLAAYLAGDDYRVVVEQARRSAEVTHMHPEGVAGGIATAVAGAYAWKHRASRGDAATKGRLIETVIIHTPPSDVRKGLERAADVPLDNELHSAALLLGNGSSISCQDTVPFCAWAAARHLDDYPAAIVAAVSVGGDVDTTCAIVGGIVALAVGAGGIPPDWLENRERLPA